MKNLMKIIFVFVFIVIVVLLVSLILSYLWNWLMPGLFGLPTINIWQALGLKVLISMLFFNYQSSSIKK
jgi:hypothetical protein